MKLIYHQVPETTFRDVSEFDRCIRDLTLGATRVDIAGPYFGVGHLCAWLKVVPSWRLVTDAGEAFGALGKEAQSGLASFFDTHEAQIRHVPDLHAKVLISDLGAYVGSANFTDAGLYKRTEMGVRLPLGEHHQELARWFEAIWCRGERWATVSPSARQLAPTTRTKPTGSALAGPKLVDAKAADRASAAEPTDRERLVRRLRQLANTASVADEMLDGLRKALEIIGLAASAPAVVVTVPKDKMKIAVSVGARHVVALRRLDDQPAIGLLLPAGHRYSRSGTGALRIHQFDALPGEQSPPVWVYLPYKPFADWHRELGDDWSKAVLDERDRAYRSSYRRYHHKLAAQIIEDPGTRADLLATIWP